MLDSSGSGSSSYGFTGEWTDTTGLINLRARYYAPGVGRFISRDTWGGEYRQPISHNMWVYGYANPVNMTDPSGYCVFCKPGDWVKVDARVTDGELGAIVDPRTDAGIVGYLSDYQSVLISPEATIGFGWAEWRKVSFLPTGGTSIKSGWVRSVYLLDNCSDGSFFSCLPAAISGKYDTQGFGPYHFAKTNYPTLEASTCPYKNLRGLHNGLDFYGNGGMEIL